MAQRKHKKYRRVDSSEVQGDGSFVLLKSPGFSELRSLGKLARMREEDVAEIESLGSIVSDLIVEWNWVDDDNNPLPQAKDKPEIIDELSYQEQIFVIESLSNLGELSDQKN